MARDNADAAKSAVLDLNIIFMKEACIENVIIYIRENQIRNETVLESDQKTASSSFHLTLCRK